MRRKERNLHRQLYGDGITVDWTDEEWERLQAIKQAKYECTRPDRTMRVRAPSTDEEKRRINVNVTKELYEKTKMYANERGITLSYFMSMIMEVITYDNS